VLSLPSLGSYVKTACAQPTWQASGAGSVLVLPGLTNIVADNCNGLNVQALAGGQVVLTNAASMDGQVSVLADGTGSVVNLSALAAVTGTNGSASFTAQNGGAVLLTSLATMQDGSLTVSGGGVLSLPSLGSYVKTGCAWPTWQASGVGNVLDLPALSNIVADNCNGLNVQALAGGQVVLGSAATLDGTVWVLADGTGSVVNFSALAAVTGTNGSASFTAQNGGTVLLRSLATMDNGSLTVSGGGTLSLPSLGSYVKTECAGPTWQVSGAGSVLDLAGLTNLVVESCNGLFVQALAGGQVVLTNVTSLDGPVSVLADGSGSVVNLSRLVAVTGTNGSASFTAQNEGSVLLPLLAVSQGASFVAGPASVLVLPSLPTMENGSLTLSGGGTLSLPSLGSYVKTECAGPTWQVSGAGSVLDLAGLTNIVADSCNGLFVQVLAGGEVVLTNLTSLVGPVSVLASGTGSVVNLSKLVNYLPASTSLSAVSGGVIVLAAPLLTITAGNASMTYGGSVPALSVTYSGFVNGDTPASLTTAPSISTTGTSLSHAGSWPITASGAVDTNYTIIYAPGTLTINPAPLTITANNGSKTYGQTAAFAGTAFSSAGLLNGDSIAGVTLNSAGAAPAADIGSYSIVPSAASGPAAGNYSITYSNGTLTVNPATLTVTASNMTMVVGSALPALTAGYSGFVNNETPSALNGAPALSTTATNGSPVGTYPISVSIGSIFDPNYSYIFDPGTLTIQLPTLTITASNASMTYGGSVPALSLGYSGFVNGDTPASLAAAPSVSTTGTSLSHAGSWPITGSGAVDTNYIIVYVPGTLTINPAPLSITANNSGKTYGQAAALPGTAFSSVGLLNGDTIAGVTLSSAGAAPAAGVGSYAIVPSAAGGPRAGNYDITYNNGTLIVNPEPLTITANNADKYFGQTLTFAGTEFTASGLQNGDSIGSVTLTSAGAASTAAIAGSPYPIAVSAATGGTFAPANYSINYVNGLLTVVPVGAPPSISAVLPGAGPNTGGTTVTITGTGFEAGATVAFGALAPVAASVGSSSVLTAVTPASASGSVSVSVHNPDGNSVSVPDVFAFGVAPVITTPPASQTVNQGQSAQFQVAATGDPTLAYQWQYNGANLLEDSHTTGTQTPALTIHNAGTGDNGNYRCVVSNPYAQTPSAAAGLSVIVPPLITAPPQSAAVGAGGSVSFSVTASGTTPLGYFWYQNGGLLAGQSGPVLTLSNVQASASYQVVVSNAAGSVTSSPPAALTLLSYCATVQAAQATYPEGTNFIPLAVRTLDCGSGAPVPNSPAAVWIYTAGTSRALAVTTDSSGNGTALFTPLPVEVGLCQYAVALPGQGPPAASGSFTIIGMNLSAQSELPQLLVGVPQTNTLLLNNLTSVPLTGIAASVLGATAGVNVQVSSPASLSGNGSAQVTYILDATSATPPQAQFSIQFNSAQGASVTLPISATMSPLTAQLSAIPASLAGTMIEGSQTLVSFALTNSGGAASGPLQVNLPSAPWLAAVTAQPVPSLSPNQGGQITLALTPANGQQLGEYPGELVVQGSNSSVTIPFVFTAVSTLTGNLQVTVQDELSIYGAGQPNLAGATVSVSDFLTGTNVASQVTGASGIVTFSNLTSAYYTVTVQAANHGSFSTTLLAQANTTTPLTAFLPLQLVDYTWTVTPTTIPDTYDFTLTTVFATEVPWPVVTVSPGSINLCEIAGGSSQVDLVITNSGLIAAEGLQLAIDESNPNWSIVPLVTNLGNLAAESSLVVPAIITRLGSSTNAPSSIAAGVNWYVAALNQTEYNSTPIFIYNANPLDCEPSVGSSTPVAVFGGGSVGGAVVSSPSYNFPPPSGAVVAVTLQIDQTSVVSRNAFHATLNLANNSGAQITNVQVTINPVDANGNPAPGAFFIQTPVLNGINAVDGTGSMGLGASAQANWTLIPTTNAAPLGTTQYAIGGTLSYMLNGEPVNIPLFPVPVSVLPDPRLYLDYFLQHDVYSQDPFTDVTETPEPFALGLRVRNLGLGAADGFTITSAQPTIINNANGLLINFQIIASEVGANTNPVPSLTLDMGDINPGTNVVGIWWMTASLEGDFTNFQATFQHTDALGGQETSLVDGVNIHEMNHVVEITAPSDDGIPDFLCNDTTNVDALPDNVYSSDGNVYPVSSLTGAVASGAVSSVNSTVTVSDAADIIPPGFVYFQLPDPSGGQFPVAGVQRSDGTQLLVGPNVWQTPCRPHMAPPQPTNLLHIFDCNSTGSYTVTYGLPVTPPAATTLAAGNVTPTNATLNATVNPEGATAGVYFQWGLTANYGNVTPTDTLMADLDAAQTVTAFLDNLPPNTTVHFQAVAVNSGGTSYGGDQTLVTPPLPPPVITQVSNQILIVGRALSITNSALAATPPVTYSLGGSPPEGLKLSADGILTWTPACEQGSTTNVITVWAADSGSPPLSSSMTFSVTVSECVQVGIGSAVVQVGQSSVLPVTLLSTVGITNLSFSLASPSGCFSGWTVASNNPCIAAATVQCAGSAPPLFCMLTGPGQTLQSPSLLETVAFTALPGDSAFVPVVATNIVGFKSDGSGVGNVISLPGQVVVIGRQPLLTSSLGNNAARTLTVYGNPGTNYQMAFSTNLALPDWQPAGSILMTNLWQNFDVDQTAPQIYYRAQ
jgi:hypothetical protein